MWTHLIDGKELEWQQKARKINSCPGAWAPFIFKEAGCGEVSPGLVGVLRTPPVLALALPGTSLLFLLLTELHPAPLLPCNWRCLPHPLLASAACVCYCSSGAVPGLAVSQTCGYSMYSECSAKFVIILD